MHRAARWAIPLFIALCALAAAPRASAQDYYGDAYAFPVTDSVQPMLYGSMFNSHSNGRSNRGRRSSRSGSRAAPQRSAQTGAAPAGSFTVNFNPALSREVRSEFIRSIGRSSGSQAARELERYYAANDVHALFRKAITPYGLHIDDYGDILAAYVAVMWMTANDAALPSVAEVRGLREQTRATLIREGNVPGDPARRQRTAEGLMYQIVTLIRVRETAQASNNRAVLAKLGNSAQDAMLRQGLNLRAMALTGTGLHPR